MYAEKAEQVDADEECRVAVEAVIEKLAQWSASARAARLFSVNPIQSVRNEDIYASNNENPFRNRVVIHLRGCCCCCCEAIVVIRNEKTVENGEHETGEGKEVGRDPQGEKL